MRQVWRLVLLLLLVWALAAQADVLELSRARAITVVNGVTSIAEVQLPYHWDLHNKGTRGEATFIVEFELPEVPDWPWGLYIPRIGNAYEITLNGVLLQRQGDLVHYNGADYSQAPRHTAIAPSVLQHHNRFQISVRADMGRRGGLAAVTVGPESEIEDLYRAGNFWRHTGSLLVAAFSLVVGLMALAIWATQTDATVLQRRDPLYLYAALAELSWVVGVGYVVFEVPPLPWPWWGLVPLAATTSWMCNTLFFCIEVAGWSNTMAAKWFRRWLLVFSAAAIFAAFWAIGGGQPLALTVMYAVSSLNTFIFGSIFMWCAVREGTLGHRLVATAIFVNMLVGVRDLYVYRIQPVLGEITWIRYASVLFGFSLAYIVILRFRAASAEARHLMATLESRVASKELELGESYKKLEVRARAHERSEERTRILRDMHDGVGAHISTAIRQLQSGQAKDSEVLVTLRESLDQLKLSIDAMTLPAGDVTALLANLRYRMEPQFKALDIALQWDVELLDPLPHLDDKGMRSLQFLVYGAIANVLQHSGASVLRIEARRQPQGVQVCIVDNGCGFDTTLPKRRGLLSMEERARAIGATLRLYSAPGATTVEIGLV